MLTDEEYEAFSERCKTYGMSQAEMIRQSITGAVIHPIIKVSAASDELLSSVGRMTSEYGKIGSNLNQIARFLNACTIFGSCRGHPYSNFRFG